MAITRVIKSTKEKYYECEPNHESSFYSNWKLINQDRLQSNKYGLIAEVPWPDGVNAVTRGPWTIPSYVEPPHFVIAKKNANTLSDFGIIDGFMFISARVKAIFEEFAPDSCEYRLCRVEYTDGTSGPETWMCSVTKVFRDSVDISKSRVAITGQGVYSFLDFQFSGGGYLVFLRSEIRDAKLFQLNEYTGNFFCAESIKLACKSAKLRGMTFKLFGESSQ